jgi:hypothetical protein
MIETALPAARNQSRLRNLFKKLVLVICSVLVALLIVEIGLRISGFTYFNPSIADPDVGYALRPDAEGWWTREGRTYIKINSQGFRDRERAIAKAPGTFRIAIIGDSFAEAFQVPLEKTFWSVMEQQLPRCFPDGRKIEVLNFGVSGFSTARELILLRTRVWQYSPDMIVLLFTPGNDVRDNSRAITRYAKQALPYFVFNDGKLVQDDSLVAERNRTLSFRLQRSLPGRLFDWVRSHSRVLGLLYTAREGLQSPRVSDRDQQNEPGLDSEVYRAPATPEWEDAWRVTEALIIAIGNEAQIKRARFLVVTGSAGIQVNPDAATRQKFMERLGVNSLYYPDDRIRSLGQGAGFDVLNLAESLHDYANNNRTFVQGSSETGGRGHWNEIGHRLAGELIVKEICRKRF